MLQRLIAFVLVLMTGLFAGLVLTGRMRTAGESSAQPEEAVTAPTPQARPALAAQSLPDLTGIAERAVSAVTSVSSTQIVRGSPFMDPFGRFDDLFGPRRAQSLGSGVIVSADGYVLTNHHVIEGGTEIAVILSDKRELRAKVIGSDEMTDLAVLKIEGGRFPTLPWGDSSKLRVAEWVLAIGNPFGVFNQSVTLGIVSATGRSVEGLSLLEDFIQTDAAINKGNSGGALINARGELVGINSAIYSETGGYQGIGLAVPSNLARKTLDELVKNGVIRRGTIPGIQLERMNAQYARELRAPDASGVLVYSIARNAPAAEAGLRPGDIIISFNGTTIESDTHFLRLLAEAEVGSTATLGIIRDGRRSSVRVPIAQAQPSRRRR